MCTTKKYEIGKYRFGEISQFNDTVVVEYDLAVFLNNNKFVNLLCSPKAIKELVVGFLFSEGVIDNIDNILDIDIDIENNRAKINLSDDAVFLYKGDDLYLKRTLTTACGKGKTLLYPSFESYKEIENNLEIDYRKILFLVNQFSKKSELFIETGGVHSCGLCNDQEIILFEEDIGRHNAMDKIIGNLLINKIPVEDKILLTTGRVSSEIILKIAKIKIPVLVSRSAPTDKAVELARKLNIKLIGFARGEKLNIYS